MLCRYIVNRNLKTSLGSCKSVKLQSDVGEEVKVSLESLINGQWGFGYLRKEVGSQQHEMVQVGLTSASQNSLW